MTNENKLGIMPINKLIWNMSLPIIASMLVQALYNIVDSIFVSQISEQALTAVSLAFPAQQLMISLASGTAVGINALVGRALGAGNRKRANDVACNGLFLAVVSSLVCAVLVLLFSNTFFSAQTKVQSIIDMGNDYLLIVGCCSIGVFLQIIFERLLQSTGRSVLSMLTQGVGLHGGRIVAPLCFIRDFEKDAPAFDDGDIIVCKQTTGAMFSLLRKASGLVLEDPNPDGHGAIAGMTLDSPVIVGALGATKILKSGTAVTVDGKRGLVFTGNTDPDGDSSLTRT